MDRREALKKIGAASAVGAGAALITSTEAFAAVGSCCAANSSYTLLASCAEVTFRPSPRSCRADATSIISVCRPSATTVMLLSRNTAGTQRPYFDEVGWMSVTSPSGTTRSQNFVGWQNTCRLGATLPDASASYGSNNGQPCGTTTNPATDISALFGSECGVFTVTLQVLNRISPYGYSTVYIVPV